jgi:hypothetical protein
MAQSDLIKVSKGVSKVIIKTNPDDELPTFTLDMSFSKSNALKIMAYALQLKDTESED